MSGLKYLQDLIEKPYGPYPDSDILSTAFPRKGYLPVLESLQMRCENTWIGFDETEFIIRAREDSRIARSPIHVYGKLEIEQLDWLSERGKKWLETDLRARDNHMHMVQNVKGSQIVLEWLYGSVVDNEPLKMSVIVQVKKSMLSQFLTSTQHPQAFLIHSKEKNRTYSIKSLHVKTLSLSLQFFARFRLWSLVREIVALDSSATPVENRTIDWLVAQYLQPEFLSRDRFRRLIGNDDNDSDIDDLGNTRKPRHTRHISHSEIKGIISEQAEWLLAYMLAPSHRNLWIIHVPSWIQFCRSVKRERREAYLAGVRWGVPKGTNIDISNKSDKIDLTVFGEDSQFWSKKLKAAMQLSTRVKKNRPLSLEIPLELTSTRALSEEVAYVPPLARYQHKPSFVYDSDFSEASTSSASSSSSNELSLTFSGRIPWYCYRPPVLPNGRFKWHCPGCSYAIDLLNLTEQNLAAIPADVAHLMRKRSWKYIKEGPVQKAFFGMVNNHYQEHIEKSGLQLIRENGKQAKILERPS